MSPDYWHSINRELTNEEKKEWVMKYLGEAFIRGVAFGKNYVKVIAKYDNGEREVIISTPRKLIRF